MTLHEGGVVLTTGALMESALAGVILIHGRGADARDIIGLAPLIDASGIAFAAPEAVGHSWYPHSFLAPLAENEPGISSGLRTIDGLLEHFQAAGISADRTLLLGFSQGACLVLEYAARHAKRFGGVAGLSGGLIGPPDTSREYEGSLDGTPVFLGCGDMDPHIPKERVEETAAIMDGMGARVVLRFYPGMGHGINDDEVDAVRGMVAALIARRG